MALLPNFPISGDDYTVGKITTVAGSKDFKTKDAYLQSYGAVQAGDHVYIAQAAKFLIIAAITGENSGTLTDPCPEDCAVTDADLRIIFKTASSRLQGRTAMLLERLSKGCLASLAELTPTEGQFIRATGVSGQLETVNMSAAFVEETDDRKFMPPIIPAGKIEETDDRKFMTAKDRQSIDNVVKRVDGLTTDNVPETDTHKYFPPDFNADSLAETPNHKVMTAAEREKIAGLDQQIEDSCAAVQNACVTDSQMVGWVDITIETGRPTEMTSGYVVTAVIREDSGRTRICGRQPQLKIANRGWFPLGAW
ncbi:hypothetical protein H3S83_11065 [Bartonella sp. W8122]|uniref:hypothetical protein n=1 Tax=Bartonella sp. W8122 TaxID=2750930 RepID=UPI0018DCC8C6|nr:hypothetical protein [Bartonella sp. W8122]MBI0002363.1 hypothetical protein [Bartonella sp. W8122]